MSKVHSPSQWWNLSNHRIVVTGHTGFLGRNLVERFRDSEFLYIGRDHTRIKEIPAFAPTLIFHFGAEIYQPQQMVAANILFTQQLLEAVKTCHFTAFIYCGSSSEYGQKDTPMSESHVMAPRNLYEATKGAGTLLCQAYAHLTGQPIYIVRPFSVYGRYDKEHKFIPTLCRAFHAHSSVTLYPGHHDWIYVDDFIDGVLTVALSSANVRGGEIFNIGTGVQTSNHDVYRTCCDVFGYAVPLRHYDTFLRPYDSSCWVADMRKMVDTYQFRPRYTLTDGLMEMTYEHQSDSGAEYTNL